MSSNYCGPERRDPGDVHGRMTKIEDALRTTNSRLDRFDTAMFAKDSDNEFNRPGLVITADRLDKHLDTICKVAVFLKNVAIGVFGAAASAATLAKAMGWL
ncbi:MAG: hypothetical protein IT531_03110 [Burkholderiales bacterium]|nr:hypothetical protein [Burkholderiales bacterium]